MPIETLDQTAIDIDSVEWTDSVLEAKYVGGYQDGINVGPLGGLHKWALSAGVLCDHASYNDPVGGVPSFQYYWEFFKARKGEGNSPFIIEFRGLNYHAAFADPAISMERFTNDLFGGGVVIEQRRVRGVSYETDGSITPEEEP